MSQKIYSAAQNSATQNSATQNSAAQNQILASLPAEDYERLKPHFRRLTMPLGEVLCRPMEPITKLYFPVTALLSWISLLEDELMLTHEFMGKMLGIRRSSVTVSAGILQQAGMIRYTRGRLSILDRPRLEETACECYQIVQAEYHRLLGSRSQHSHQP